MRIEKRTFVGNNSNPHREFVAEGALNEILTDHSDGSTHIFIHTGPGANGYVIIIPYNEKIGLRS